MGSIHALQSSTTSHQLLKSVRSLRPLLCEALRASGCNTNEQEPALHGVEGLQNEGVQCPNSHDSGQHHDIFAQCLHVEELANLLGVSSYDGQIHDHYVNDQYDDHSHVDLQVHSNPTYNYAANDGSAVLPLVEIQHHDYGYGRHDNAKYQHYGNVYPKEFEHNGDALHHGYGQCDAHHHGHVHYGDAHHHGHGDEHGYNSNSIIMSPDHLPQIIEYCSELLEVQKYQEQTVQRRFCQSFPMTSESYVNVDPHTALSCTHYPQVDNHLLDYQQIGAYHNHHLQHHISSETMASETISSESYVNVDPYTTLSCTQYPQVDNHLLYHQQILAYHNHHLQQSLSSEAMAFTNNVLLEAPASFEGTISNGALLGAEASNKRNSNNEGVRAQESSSRSSENNIEIHEACAGHQAADCCELPPLPKLSKHMKRPPRTMSKQLESSCESTGTDNKEGGKMLSPQGETTIHTANLFSERRRRKKWNESLYALRALVPFVSKMDKLSIIGDTLTYLHQLKNKVDNLQNDICSLQSEKEHFEPSEEGLSICTSEEMETGKDSGKHKILELDVLVVDMEQKTYHLCIRCEREDLVLLELTKALEALNFNMLNANIAVTNENQILYTVVVKVDTIEVLTPEVLKESILKSATMFGFQL